MWGQIDGENKITIAKGVLKDLTQELPDGTQVGLIAYGHRQKGDCEDIETIVEVSPIDKAALNEKIDALNPKGKTPITDSVLMAFESVKDSEDAVTVILVSDGIETCGGDPCKAVKEAKDAGVNFIMHVVGFDVSKEDVSQLECSAQAGGGRYFSADNAEELSLALKSAVEIPADLPTGKLSVKVTAEGSLKDAIVIALNKETGEDAGGGRTYKSENTNPRILPLPDGTYTVVVKPLGIKGARDITFEDVVITEGETVEKIADFSFGELSVEITLNGKLGDATINIFEAGTKNNVARGRSYKSSNNNPKKFKLTPGAYDVAVKSVEVKNSPTEEIMDVQVTSGETTEKQVEFTSGVLRLGAVNEGKLVDAVLKVYDTDKGAEVASGRSYTRETSNPKDFPLLPGTYKAVVKPVKSENLQPMEFEVEIKAGETTEQIADFSE